MGSLLTTAVILAGGRATRMGKICESIPKSMLPIGNYPFLSWVVSWLCRNNVSVIISALHNSEKIEDYFSSGIWKKFPIQIEKEIFSLGTGGAIKSVAEKINSENFLVLNGDTVLKFNIRKVLSFHVSHYLPVTQVATEKSNQNQGAVLVDEEGKILSFEEGYETFQALNLKSTFRLSSTGCYIFNTKFVLEFFPSGNSSLELEIMPSLSKRKLAMAYKITDEIYDFGTPERYKKLKDRSDWLAKIYNYPFPYINVSTQSVGETQHVLKPKTN